MASPCQMSYSEDTTDLARRGIMDTSESVDGAIQIEMTWVYGKRETSQEATP